ncbi:CHASE domain-containing protein [Desulfuromonas sp. TF]|uniref:CHASE domain-containing protein n=1 Tax=Desulfuromonas sp. TF TaxID=1232410 RepID=UPI000423A8DF|nr:CHASE domain-containing protein [Desulfuromonas sp. TF]
MVLAISLAFTFFLWRIVDRGIIERAEQLFQGQAEVIASRIVKRLHDHEQVLLGGNALFHVKGDAVTRSDWRQYVSALDLRKHLPGILGFGYAVWLSPAQKEAHIKEVRLEGFPEYVIRPEGERPVYTSIIWLEPFDWRNRRAFGYDMYSEPVRRKAMDRARDTGKTSITAKVLLVQETEQDPQNGMLMYVPSYRQGMPTDTVEERRAALRGFVYSPIRMTDYVRNTLGELPTEIEFEIYAGETRSDDHLMFSSRSAEELPPPHEYRPAFSAVKIIDAFGVNWQFTFRTLPAFDKEFNRSKSMVTLLTGILASILLSVLAFLQAQSRRQALTIADQMAQQLAARQRLALHIEQTPLAAIEWDDHFRVTAWNRAAEKIFDYSAEEAIGAHASFILPDAEQRKIEKGLPEFFQNTGAKSATIRNITKSGKIIVCDWYNTKLVNKSGTVIGVASLAQDITERLQAMERLKLATEAAEVARGEAEQANRAKSEFLANMSHEIRTPMTVFMGAVEHLLQIDTDPDRRNLLEMAEQSAQRLRSLIDDILDLSRIEAHGLEIEEREFELRSCVRGAVGLFTMSARERNLRLETEVAPEVPGWVLGDPDWLGQVLINLVGNALKFTPEGEIRVSVKVRGDLLEFAVADTGIGIPEEKQHLLFQKFSQTDSSFHRQYGGSGLGLAISKGLVELMGGQIDVQSRKGKGSVFTFTLPLKTVSERQSVAPPAETPLEVTVEEIPSARILIAEDDPLVREMVRMTLARGGWESETAETGREALKRYEQGSFDLILMDLQMPEMDGIEATRAIRRKEAEDGARRTFIIGLTAHARPEIKEECLNAGMDEVLIKPVQMKDLSAAIGRCLSKSAE